MVLLLFCGFLTTVPVRFIPRDDKQAAGLTWNDEENNTEDAEAEGSESGEGKGSKERAKDGSSEWDLHNWEANLAAQLQIRCKRIVHLEIGSPQSAKSEILLPPPELIG